MFTSVIIPAAGLGERMGASVSKQFLLLQGKPLLVHTLLRFEQCEEIDALFVAAHRSHFSRIEKLIEEFHLTKVKEIVEGGEQRQDSVAHALAKIDAAEIVLIHDAVRPFIHRSLILQSIAEARTHSASVVAVRVKDTVKVADANRRIERTLDRRTLWAVQTPQTFLRPVLVKAYAEAEEKKIRATDDATLVESIGVRPVIIEGSYDNIKITTPEDLDAAELIARRFAE